jgi:hypothetical protein
VRRRGTPRSKRPYTTKPCETCGIPFGPPPQHDAGWRWAHWEKRRYCSHACSSYALRVAAVIRSSRSRTKGYYYIPCAWHPRAHDNGFVFEHIVVMERQLGRFLLPGENVHHKNGDPGDNRPENLELWVTTQPPGKRPEDLVAYAHEILARYA